MPKPIKFEQPLNERIRTFLRFEQLVQRFEYSTNGDGLWDAHWAIITLLEISDLSARGDLKCEIMKELKRQISNMESIGRSPGVDQGYLQAIITKHRQLIEDIHEMNGKPISELKNNEFLKSIKQRTSIPGGTCDFDLPAYHNWLSRPIDERRSALKEWMTLYQKIYHAVDIILTLIRGSVPPQHITAYQGFYQQTLDANRPFQLIRIFLSFDTPYYPEISAGKHRFSIRFLSPPNVERRPIQTENDVDFRLACCAL